MFEEQMTGSFTLSFIRFDVFCRLHAPIKLMLYTIQYYELNPKRMRD